MVLLKNNKIRILNTELFRPEEFYSDMHRRLKQFKEGKIQDVVECKTAELGEEM